MSSIVKLTLLGILSYILGSIPFGLILAKKVKGLDIRDFGSGNIGATNVARVIGLGWGILVFLLDFLKGFLPVCLVFFIFESKNSLINISSIATSLLAVCGHNWPIFLRFKGGKGVSTSLGAIASLSIFLPFLRVPLLLSISSWVLVFLMSKIVGLASIITSVIFFLGCVFMKGIPLEFKILSFLISLFVILRHKRNIQNLLKRTLPNSKT